MLKKCAYCKGTGKSPFSHLFRCPVCRGKEEIEVAEPVKKCPFCKGEGRPPLGTCCRVCGGKGFITQPEQSIKCDRCKGSGKEPESRFALPGRIPCYQCKGLGFIPLLVVPEPLPKTPPKAPPVPKKPSVRKPFVKKAPKVKKERLSLTDLPGVTPQIAEALKKKGYKTVENIATASVVRLEEVEGLTLGKAAKLINDTREKLKKLGKEYLWE